jgi:hypothetical protein
MTREQIEKAAFQCAKDRWEYSGVQYAKVKVRGTVFGFKMGAQWRINSVWHEPSAYGEELKRDVHVIARIKRGFCIGRFDVVGYFHEYIGFITQSGIEFPLSDILEYAYLEDLLPERKEKKK